MLIYRMSDYVKRALPLLQVIAKSKPKIRNAIIEHGPGDLIKAISEIVLNVLKGVIKLTARQKKVWFVTRTNFVLCRVTRSRRK